MSDKITAKIIELTGAIHILREGEVVCRIYVNNKEDWSDHIIEIHTDSRIEIRPQTSMQIQLKF